jgi:hypothetical protein
MKIISLSIALAVLTGCATATSKQSASGIPADVSSHLDDVWLVKGVTFRDYDLLYVADVDSDVSANAPHAGAIGPTALMLKMYVSGEMRKSEVFPRVTDYPPRADSKARVLRLQCTIVESTHGSQDLRYWVGLGTGMPHLRVRTQFIDQKTRQVICEAERTASGLNGAVFEIGGFMGDNEILEPAIRKYAKKLAKYVTDVSKR